jgi:hypothetical protein
MLILTSKNWSQYHAIVFGAGWCNLLSDCVVISVLWWTVDPANLTWQRFSNFREIRSRLWQKYCVFQHYSRRFGLGNVFWTLMWSIKSSGYLCTSPLDWSQKWKDTGLISVQIPCATLTENSTWKRVIRHWLLDIIQMDFAKIWGE